MTLSDKKVLSHASTQSVDEYENNYSRLYVSNLSPGFKQESLYKLFEKICEVKDVYIPETTITGINRGFAIVSVKNVGQEILLKCIKSFNNCFYEGCKIKVEAAKSQYYKDRLAKEKLSEKEAINNQTNKIESPVKDENSNSAFLKIRKSRQTHILACTIPVTGTAVGTRLFNDEAYIASRRIVFDDNGNNFPIDGEISTSMPVMIDKYDKRKEINENVENLQFLPRAKKQRLGFGTLLAVDSKCVDCIDSAEISSSTRNDLDEVFDDYETANSREVKGIDNSIDKFGSFADGFSSENVLLKEKQRNLEILKSLLGEHTMEKQSTVDVVKSKDLNTIELSPQDPKIVTLNNNISQHSADSSQESGTTVVVTDIGAKGEIFKHI
jgi:hypothetical protein